MRPPVARHGCPGGKIAAPCPVRLCQSRPAPADRARVDCGRCRQPEPRPRCRGGRLRCSAKRGEKGDDAVPEGARLGASALIAQEILLFCFQQDLEAGLTRALNLDDTERAQDVRERLQRVDEAVQQIQAAKEAAGRGQEDGGPPAPNLQDAFSESVRLRAALQEAVMAEDYKQAARLRDELAVVQQRVDEASGRATLIRRKLEQTRRLRLGQRVTHATEGYQAAVCGWDASCCESPEWQAAAGVPALEAGAAQPFYQLLVDLGSGGSVATRLGPVAYVAQELLREPQSSWVEEHGEGGLDNPLAFNLFLGQDERGDLLPVRGLREKYAQARRDVFPPGQEPPPDDPANGGGEGGQ